MKLRHWTSLTLGWLATGLFAQPVSDSPLRNFRLPVFNEQGHRVLDLSSAAVRMVSERPIRLEMTTVHVSMLAPDGSGTLEGELFAPVAVYDQAAQTVSGTGELHVIYHGADLFGNDWTYHADTKSIVIEHDVVVTFAGELGNLLQ